MKKHLGMFVLALLVAAVLLTGTVGYKVDITEYALVKTFGKTTSAVDGRTEAGLKFKWPWPIQKLVRYDAQPPFSRTYPAKCQRWTSRTCW